MVPGLELGLGLTLTLILEIYAGKRYNTWVKRTRLPFHVDQFSVDGRQRSSE